MLLWYTSKDRLENILRKVYTEKKHKIHTNVTPKRVLRVRLPSDYLSTEEFI